MKRLMSVAVLAMLVFLPLQAHERDQVKAALMRTEQSLLDSLLKGDGAPIKAALADSFVFIAPDGTTQKATPFVADISNGNLKMASSVYDDMDVRLYGDTAVVTYRSTDKGMYKDTDISGQYRWTDVFVKQHGQWRIVATQGTPIAPAKP